MTLRPVVLHWTETVRARAWVAGPYRVVKGLHGYEAYYTKVGGAIVYIGHGDTPDAAKRRCRTHAERPR